MEDECPICYEHLTQSQKTLQCGHTFHNACINRWSLYSPTCPYCRDQFAPQHLHPRGDRHCEMLLMMAFVLSYTYLFYLAAFG